MSTFLPSDAAVSGFRFIGREPRTVSVWAAVIFACELVYGAVVVGLARDNLPAVRALAETNRTDPEAAMSMLPAVSLLFLFTLLLMLAAASVMFTAAYRAWLAPGDPKRAHLEFGGDELRMAVLIVLWAVLTLGGSFVIAFVSGLLTALGSVLPSPLAPIYFLILLVAVVAAFAYPIVRLSLSMPMTFEDRHVRLLESWKATRGHFWPLFSAYILSAILLLVVVLATWTVVGVVATIVFMGLGVPLTHLSGLFRYDTSSLAAYFSPATLVALVLNAIAAATGFAVFTGPVAEAYRWLIREGGSADGHAEAPRTP